METIRWVGDGILTVRLVRRLGARWQKFPPGLDVAPLEGFMGLRKEKVAHAQSGCPARGAQASLEGVRESFTVPAEPEVGSRQRCEHDLEHTLADPNPG